MITSNIYQKTENPISEEDEAFTHTPPTIPPTSLLNKPVAAETSSSSTPVSPIVAKRKQNMVAFNSRTMAKATSAEILSETVKRMRKLSRSADNINHIQKTTAMVQKTLKQSNSLVGLSADNIYFMSRTTPHSNNSQKATNKKLRSSIDDVREARYCVSPLTLPVHDNTTRGRLSPLCGEIPTRFSPSRVEISERQTELDRRRVAAKQKQTERQNLLNSLNKDIKQANRYLRNLKTRSLPLLESMNINFEIPYDFIQAVLAPKRGRLNSMSRVSVDLIV